MWNFNASFDRQTNQLNHITHIFLGLWTRDTSGQREQNSERIRRDRRARGTISILYLLSSALGSLPVGTHMFILEPT